MDFLLVLEAPQDPSAGAGRTSSAERCSELCQRLGIGNRIPVQVPLHVVKEGAGRRRLGRARAAAAAGRGKTHAQSQVFTFENKTKQNKPPPPPTRKSEALKQRRHRRENFPPRRRPRRGLGRSPPPLPLSAPPSPAGQTPTWWFLAQALTSAAHAPFRLLTGTHVNPPPTSWWGCLAHNLPRGGVLRRQENKGRFFFLVLGVISYLETRAGAGKAVPKACGDAGPGRAAPTPTRRWPMTGLAGQPRRQGGLQVLTSPPPSHPNPAPAFWEASGAQNCRMKNPSSYDHAGNVHARAQPAAPNPPGSSRATPASAVVAGAGGGEGGGRRFICLKANPSLSRRFCRVWWGPSGADWATARRSALAATRAGRCAAPSGFSFIFIFHFCRCSVRRYPWASPGYFGNQPSSILLSSVSPPLLFFLPGSAPAVLRGLRRVRALPAASGPAFAASHRKRRRGDLYLFKQTKSPCNYAAILINYTSPSGVGNCNQSHCVTPGTLSP